MEYDILNRVTRLEPAVADLTESEQALFAVGPTVYVYDQAHPEVGESRNLIGRLGYTIGPVVDTCYEYDAQGHTTAHHQTLKVPGLKQASGTALVSRANYHTDGLLASTSMTNASTGEAISHPVAFGYDSRGLPSSVHYQDQALLEFERNTAGLVTKRVVPTATADRTYVVYRYDPLSRLISMVVMSADGESKPYQQHVATTTIAW